MRASMLYGWLKQWILFWTVSVAVMCGGRLFLYCKYIDNAVSRQYSGDIAALFAQGLLFDIKAASVITAVPFAIGLLCAATRRSAQFFNRMHRSLLTALFALLLLATLANGIYFQVYGKQFDVFVFGLFEEDTQAVLATMWADYPVLRIVAVVFLGGWLFSECLLRLPCLRAPRRLGISLMYVVAAVLLAVGIRGSFGKFPLRQDDSNISASIQLNRLVANAPTALDWARKEYRNSKAFRPAPDEEGIRLISAVTGKPAATADLAQFLVQTPPNPAAEKHPPNVVLAVMESMGLHLLDFDNGQRQLLGRLKNHWQQDWVFRKFVSEGDGTSDSLHRFFVRSPLMNLSQSTAKNTHFPSNMFAPFRTAGYRVVYITAGNGGWRGFDTFLRHLGVDEFADENMLKHRYPEAKSATWGVPDEFMFRYAEEKLSEAQKSGQPVFIMMLSVTNHPPYKLPPPEKIQDFGLTEAERNRLANLAENPELNEIFNTFRYANDRLGAFIGKVKHLPPDTIIAATGDHNIRAVGYPKPNEAALGHAVPFYLYVPEPYRHNAVFKPERAGSHKDIMPTLYELSLSKQNYYGNGCNLVAEKQDKPWCGYGYNTEVAVLEDGFYHFGNQTFFPWTDAAGTRAGEHPATPKHPDKIKQARSYGAFLDWQLNRMVVGKTAAR